MATRGNPFGVEPVDETMVFQPPSDSVETRMGAAGDEVRRLAEQRRIVPERVSPIVSLDDGLPRLAAGDLVIPGGSVEHVLVASRDLELLQVRAGSSSVPTPVQRVVGTLITGLVGLLCLVAFSNVAVYTGILVKETFPPIWQPYLVLSPDQGVTVIDEGGTGVGKPITGGESFKQKLESQ